MAESWLCTICARGGSKGVKNKNIRPLLGKPLIAYSIESAVAARLFDHIVISTDSDEIAETAVRFGAEVFFRRPAELATDTAAKLPVIRHAFSASEEYYGKRFDFLLDLDATSPLRTVQDILDSVEEFRRGKWDNLVTASPARRSPYFNLVETDTQGRVHLSKTLEKPVVRRQDAPKCYDMNASIYIWSRNAILSGDSVIGGNTGLFVMPEERSVDIDSDLDLEFVEYVLRKRAAHAVT